MALDPEVRDALSTAAKAEVGVAVTELRDEIARLRDAGDSRLEALEERATRIVDGLRTGRVEGHSDTLIDALAAAARVSSSELVEFLRWGIAERRKWGSRR